jgi:hypothetical protein
VQGPAPSGTPRIGDGICSLQACWLQPACVQDPVPEAASLGAYTDCSPSSAALHGAVRCELTKAALGGAYDSTITPAIQAAPASELTAARTGAPARPLSPQRSCR